MERSGGLTPIVVVATCLVLWGLVSGRLERVNVTAPLAFVVFGLLAVNPPLNLIEVTPSSASVRVVAELALALVLFSDAARINVHSLRHDLALPGRLLGLGLPLTVGLGIGAAVLCFTHVDPWVAAVIGAAVAPTDAALGAIVVDNPHVPARIRRALNVESGLNDGLATPLVAFFLAGAAASLDVAHSPTLASAVKELAGGLLGGVAVGAIGGWLIGRARTRGWGSATFAPLAVLGLALVAYAGVKDAGGNGFVAAFVGGMAFGVVSRRDPTPTHESLVVVSDGGELLSLLLWFIFGALVVSVLQHSDVAVFVYAGLSLTVVRMVPVAIALIGSRLDRTTTLFVGWFGPRGLASVVFALLAYDALDRHDGEFVLVAVFVTVLASVVLHGLTAGPLARRYGSRAGGLADDRPEHQAVEPLPSRAVGRRFSRPR